MGWGRGHFFAAAAEAMRRILINNARRKKQIKHRHNLRRVEPEESDVISSTSPDHLIAIDEALAKLSEKDKTKGELVKLRYFAGLSIEQAAQVLGMSTRSANRSWAYARAWLEREIEKDE